jgi:predicted Zn-dependent protease
LSKGDKTKALKHYLAAYEDEKDNLEAIKNILLLEIDFKHYNEVAKLSKETIEIYPTQPILYLLNGVALNKLNRSKEAIVILELGVDYVIDDIKMEIDFYKQLSLAYKLNNNIIKSQSFSKKAELLIIKQK